MQQRAPRHFAPPPTTSTTTASATTIMSGSSSFSDWFENANKQAARGQDPLATTSSSSSGGAGGSHAAAAQNMLRQASSWLGLERDVETGPLVMKEDGEDEHSGDQSSSLSRTDRFKWFTLLLGVSLLFFFLALMFLSVVLVLPGKFAFAFTCGSVMFMSAFAVAQGPQAWMQDVMKREQMPFSIAYFGSIIGTLYATLIVRNYVAIVFFAVVQLIALSYYGAAKMPYGSAGLKIIRVTIGTFCSGCFKACKGCVSLLW